MSLQNTLNHDGDNDYTLNKGEASVWITVDGYSIYIARQSDGGVKIEAFEKGYEMNSPLDLIELGPSE